MCSQKYAVAVGATVAIFILAVFMLTVWNLSELRKYSPVSVESYNLVFTYAFLFTIGVLVLLFAVAVLLLMCEIESARRYSVLYGHILAYVQ